MRKSRFSEEQMVKSLREGTIVDASLIAVPPSTKNKEGESDPDMHQTKKGNQWYLGVDAHTCVVHLMVTMAANVSDVSQAHKLLQGGENTCMPMPVTRGRASSRN